MTPAQERQIQIRVGFFTLLGLLIIGSMVTYFGRLGEGLKRFYEIRVEYPNASGLLSGADVLMAGAKIGKVADGPNILPSGEGVWVSLKVYDTVEIPSNSVFTIGSSGLLGDRFVDITMQPEAQQTGPIEPGQIIQGKRESGMGELASEGGAMLADIREAVQKVNVVVTRINEELLTEQTMGNLNASMANLKQTTESLNQTARTLDTTLTEASGKITSTLDQVDGVVRGAEGLVTEGKTTLTRATAAAEEIRGTAAELKGLVKDARTGKGLVATLLNDRALADNIRALALNLKRHGILFYRDRAEASTEPTR
jgi:phospholipid/cholesterol/gamma-HCH transport system substrate-binding protein